MKTLQLQFFDHAQRAYVPAFPLRFCQNENFKSVEAITDHARSTGKPWRIASTERALKPVFHRTRHNGYSRTVDQVQRDYLDWAMSKGLKHVTAYRQHSGRSVIRGWYYSMTFITPEEQFAVVESHEGVSEVIRGNPIDWRTQWPVGA